MALRKLPFDIQSKFHASTQIRSFKTAIEELVYNALDANSSSIAIRVNLKENYIQVVDNGHGVAKDDFNILGQRYSTSKYGNSTTYESFQMYGSCGQSLANLIEVSQNVKIISKAVNNVETWMKHFRNGKEESCSVVTERPSIGTTVEINGFLHNLTIQKKAVKSLQELQNIKTFLEQISLIHCNTSISLRDNSENEIIFKIHKNRDIIQTISSVLSVNITNLQEFQVEKNQYKVTGFIQSNNNEEIKGYQWIYVNGRFIANSNLHKIVNENLSKGAPVGNNLKTKNYNDEVEKVASNNKLPGYFIFIKCPKNEYDIISNPKQAILEFKNVIHVNKLLEKLVKFHMGDIQIVKGKTSTKPVTTPEDNKAHGTDIRNKVKQIMQKILGSQQKKLNGSNLRNGVKGKKIKRRDKKNVPLAKSKLYLKNNHLSQEEICEFNDLISARNHTLKPTTKTMRNKTISSANNQQKQSTNEKRLFVTNNTPEKKYNTISKQPVLSKFEKEIDEVHKRCNILAKRVSHLLGVKKKRKCKVFTNETIQYSNIFTNNKSVSIRKKIKEIIIHEYVKPQPQKLRMASKNDKSLKDIKKSSDLLCPVTSIINQNDYIKNYKRAKIIQPQPDPNYLHITDEHEKNIPGPTYESHGYLKDSKMHLLQLNLHQRYKKVKSSRGDLALPIEDADLSKKQTVTERIHYNNVNDITITDEEEFTKVNSIHTKTVSHINGKRNTQANESDVILFSNNGNICVGGTYTITKTEDPGSKNLEKISPRTCIIDTSGNHDVNLNLPGDVNLSEQSPYMQKTQNESAVTVDKPDVNVVFISNSQFSKTATDCIDPLKMCEAVFGYHNERDGEEIIENTFTFGSINNVIESNIPIGIQTGEFLKPVASLRSEIEDCEPDSNNFEQNDFNLKNRCRYIPKGMSPIFENCNVKNICDYELVEDYFEETVYDNFAQNVQTHSEIFKPKIQTTRDVQRVVVKLNKDNACLTFNAGSLKHAKVLGQVDNKFIATVMNGDSNGAHDSLVLFDQHAVHERVRLERNMSEYITHEQWKSISVDEFSLKLNRHEILYLHNYRDKFERLGLQWYIANDIQVMVNAIPEAILGKHQRQVDVVLKAVKNLIKEEINIIKEQGGCVSLYPKSIMDLVFSEACRYAIMFGDSLSVRECSELVEALSHCRTPFQCAHGRPALAVLVDITEETRPYMVNFTKVEQFRRKQRNVEQM